MSDDFVGDGFGPRTAPAPIGHNKPPETIPVGESLIPDLELKHLVPLKRAKELLDAAARLPAVTDSVSEGKVTDFVRQLQACTKALETARVDAKEPYLRSERAVDGFFKVRTEALDKVRKAADGRLTDYKLVIAAAEKKKRAEEQARAHVAWLVSYLGAMLPSLDKFAQAAIAQMSAKKRSDKQEAARLLAEAERANEAAQQDSSVAQAEALRAEERTDVKAADITRARGDASVGSLQEFIDQRDLEREKIDLEALRPYIGLDALEKAVNAYVRANKPRIEKILKAKGPQPLRGVELFLNHRTAVR